MGKTGALFILDHFIEDISSPLKCFRTFYWPGHGLNDVSWSETNDNILWTVSSDGLIQVWDLNSYLQSDDPLSDFDPSPDPVQVIKGHSCSITSIDWVKSSDSSSVLTSSCDTTIKLWDSSSGSLINTFPSSQSNLSCSSCTSSPPITAPICPSSLCRVAAICPIPISPCPHHEVTQVKWSHVKPHTFASTTSDGTLRIYSTKDSTDRPNIVFKPINDCGVSGYNSLTTCDWSKHDENLIVIGTSTGSVIGLDVRSVKGGSLPLFMITGHRKGVKKVTCDPHQCSTFSSVSVDSTVKIWDFTSLNCCQSIDSGNLMDTSPSPQFSTPPPDTTSVNHHPQVDLVTTFDHHTDHVTGFSFNSTIKDQVVDCSKESLIYLYTIGSSRKPSFSSPNSSSFTISTSSSLDSVRASFDT